MDELKAYEDRMKKTVEKLKDDYNGIRAGRANPHLLDKITVDYYGTSSPIHNVANVSVPEARVIQIVPWEKKMIKEIEKAINKSDLGINPTNDGSSIRLVFPEMNEERRRELSKQVKKYAENAKVSVRNVRRDAMSAVKKLEKDGEFTEDDLKNAEKEMQKITDIFTDQIDKICKDKTEEIMTV